MRIGNPRYWLFQAIDWGSFALTNIFFAIPLKKWWRQVPPDYPDQAGFLFSWSPLHHLMRFAVIRFNVLQRAVEKR